MNDSMYACRTANGLYELRQARYRDQRNTRNGKGHPHDVCAVARTAQELRDMTAPHWPNADFSEVELGATES